MRYYCIECGDIIGPDSKSTLRCGDHSAFAGGAHFCNFCGRELAPTARTHYHAVCQVRRMREWETAKARR